MLEGWPLERRVSRISHFVDMRSLWKVVDDRCSSRPEAALIMELTNLPAVNASRNWTEPMAKNSSKQWTLEEDQRLLEAPRAAPPRIVSRTG